MGQVQLGRLHQAPLRGDAIEEGDELQLEEDHRVDGGAAHLLVAVPHQVANKGQVQLLLQPAVEVVRWEQRLQVRLGEQLEPFRSMTHHLTAPHPKLSVKASIPPDFFNSLLPSMTPVRIIARCCSFPFIVMSFMRTESQNSYTGQSLRPSTV